MPTAVLQRFVRPVLTGTNTCCFYFFIPHTLTCLRLLPGHTSCRSFFLFFFAWRVPTSKWMHWWHSAQTSTRCDARVGSARAGQSSAGDKERLAVLCAWPSAGGVMRLSSAGWVRALHSIRRRQGDEWGLSPKGVKSALGAVLQGDESNAGSSGSSFSRTKGLNCFFLLTF